MAESLPVPQILVVDDDTEVRYSLNRVLSSRNFKVLEAASGEEGVAAGGAAFAGTGGAA